MPQPAEQVILIHGLWMNTLAMRPLGHRLAAHGFLPAYFNHRSLGRRCVDNADRLAEFIDTLPAGPVHLLGHSLGGLIILHYYARHSQARDGRAVLLGSPVNGSAVAQHFQQYPWTRPLLGRAMPQGLDGDLPPAPQDRGVGVIAGNFGLGLTSLLAGQSPDGDGAVAVEETRLQGATDWRLMPVSHAGMLLSTKVADAAARFFRDGHF